MSEQFILLASLTASGASLEKYQSQH